MQTAPIIVFVYNRPIHTEKCINALKRNNLSFDTTIYIFSDGAKQAEDVSHVLNVRRFIHTITGFKNIIIEESDYNRGLANSVIYGVSKVLENYENVIVLEDDIECSPHFLKYMNDCLNKYRNNHYIWSISAYTPVFNIPKSYNENQFLTRRISSWGYATWKNRWEKSIWNINEINNKYSNPTFLKSFDKKCGNDLSSMIKRLLLGKIDSWAVRWQLSCYLNNGYIVYSNKSLVKNIGLDGSGIHCGKIDYENTPSNYTGECIMVSKKVKFNENVNAAYLKTYRTSIFLKIRHVIRPLLIKLNIFQILQKFFHNITNK